MTPNFHERLEGLARAATPREWRIEGRRGLGYIVSHGVCPEGDGPAGYVGTIDPMFAGDGPALEANAAYIAAANPQAILALIAENRAYREALISLQVQASNAAYNLNQAGITLDTADAARAFDNIALSARAVLTPIQQGGQSHG